MSTIRKNVRGEKRQARKAYRRPQVIKHGKVENLTKCRRRDNDCSSKPFNWDV
jgi:hypothetical protein